MLFVPIHMKIKIAFLPVFLLEHVSESTSSSLNTVFSLRFHCPILFLIVSSDILSHVAEWPLTTFSVELLQISGPL